MAISNLSKYYASKAAFNSIASSGQQNTDSTKKKTDSSPLLGLKNWSAESILNTLLGKASKDSSKSSSPSNTALATTQGNTTLAKS